MFQGFDHDCDHPGPEDERDAQEPGAEVEHEAAAHLGESWLNLQRCEVAELSKVLL